MALAWQYSYQALIGYFANSLSRTDLIISIWHHLRALVFNFLACLYLGYYFKCLVLEDVVLTDIFPNTSWWWIEVLAIVRAMRWIWHNTVRFIFLGLIIQNFCRADSALK